MSQDNSTSNAGISHSNNKGATFTIEQLFSLLDNVPVCINVLNEKAESLYCNAYTVDLYGVDSKQSFIDNFYKLVPKCQPDGRDSLMAFSEHVLTALEKGENQFNWLDIDAEGEELPLYITIYRMNTKDENGDELLVSTMHDLRSQLAGYEENTISDDYYNKQITYRALFNTVAELTEEWFWIYDVNMSTIQFFGKGREILGLSAEKQPFPSYVVDGGMVHPDDLNTFLYFNRNLKKGVVEPIEVRFFSQKGISKYYKIIYKTVYNSNGSPLFSVGKTFDIDKQKKLEVLSKTDLLTNCLNKVTTENVVKDIIDTLPDSSHALFLIDVDDFKSVNDELGHYFGDITLSDIAKNLQTNFRGGDIIGRIGGDEFLVFVKNLSDPDVIKSKAAAIANAFKTTYSGENNDYKISGSIGVALYPNHATTYEELYKCADKALYGSKMAGKDRYTIYTNELSDSNTKLLTVVDNANKLAHSYFDLDVVSSTFDLMYEAENTDKSMNTVLSMMGRHMNADRCYIAQMFDGQGFDLTYEWTSSTTTSRKNDFQNISLEDLKIAFAELEKTGIMCSNCGIDSNVDAVHELADNTPASSFLLVQTKGKRNTRLVLGVEDSKVHRVWSEKEINTLQYATKMISIFLSSSNFEKK